MKNFIFPVIIFLSGLILMSCYRVRGSRGGGQVRTISTREIKTSDILLPPGYRIEAIAQNFTFISGLTFDEKDRLYVIESGYAYGEVWTEPKLIRIEADGSQTTIARGTRNGPWTGVTYYDGFIYVAEGGELEGGKILRISPSGEIKTLVDNLPSVGDHHTNGPVIKDGYLYFGQGTATNSAVVGTDNAEFGWLLRKKDFHDIPCQDITLTGNNYESANVLTDNPDDKTFTGAYSSFGKTTTDGQVIKGSVPCTGSILRIPITGGNVELVAWGLRNPFGLAFSPQGKLYITENGFDERGSRPVWGAGDVLWEIKNGTWYGWPDFSEGKPISNDEEFKAPPEKKVKPLLKIYPNTPPKPAAILGVHSSASGFDFSRSKNFGYENEAFIAEFGDMAPSVGKVLRPVGFKVVRVDMTTGVVRDFAVNKGKRNGPATWLKSGGLERPLACKFNSGGDALYVVDFGILQMSDEGPKPRMKTGVIWKITKDGKL